MASHTRLAHGRARARAHAPVRARHHHPRHRHRHRELRSSRPSPPAPPIETFACPHREAGQSDASAIPSRDSISIHLDSPHPVTHPSWPRPQRVAPPLPTARRERAAALAPASSSPPACLPASLRARSRLTKGEIAVPMVVPAAPGSPVTSRTRCRRCPRSSSAAAQTSPSASAWGALPPAPSPSPYPYSRSAPPA